MTLTLGQQMPLTDPFAVAALVALRGREPQTLSELSKSTGLSRPTVSSALTDLDRRGWVERLDPATIGGAGRPAMRFRFRAERGVVTGVDAGVHKILVVVSDLNDQVLGEHRVQVEPTMTGALRVKAVLDAVVEAVDTYAPQAHLLAVGVGAPGIVDALGRISISPAIPEWDGIDLSGRLRRALRCAVLVENDVHAATLGESKYGAGRGAGTFAYLMAGYRTSSGIVIDGKLHRGWSGAAGMVGEMDILEWRKAPDLLVSASSPSGASIGTALQVFQAASDGDGEAQAAVDRYVDSVAIGLAALSLAVDPELIVVGGGISLVGRKLAESLRSRLLVHAGIVHPRIEISELGDRAVAVGGVRRAFDYVESSVFDLSVVEPNR